MSSSTAQTRQAISLPRGGEEALRPYSGKWIATDLQGEVRGSGETAEEAQRAAKQAGVERALYFFVVEGA